MMIQRAGAIAAKATSSWTVYPGVKVDRILRGEDTMGVVFLTAYHTLGPDRRSNNIRLLTSSSRADPTLWPFP
jgi:hypothetical protein